MSNVATVKGSHLVTLFQGTTSEPKSRATLFPRDINRLSP